MLIRRTCAKLIVQKDIKINDIPRTNRPHISLKSIKGLPNKWLFDTGAGLTCISLKAFRKINIEDRPVKLSEKGRKASGATGQALIPMGCWLVSLEARAGALASMHSFAVSCQDLLTEDILR